VKRISFWFLSTLSAVVLLVGFDASRHSGALTATPPSSSVSSGKSSTTTSGGTNNQGNGSSSGSSRSSSGSSSGSSKSSGSTSSQTATVTGSAVQTQWGPVQVQLVVNNGTIAQVRILQYPNGNSRDVEIASYSLPILIRETKQSQSANIDMVSGATFTSEGYIQSLQSALDQANL
jgi:uncharacterized protein with FMN-binding domain